MPSGHLMEIHSPTQRALRVSKRAARWALKIQIQNEGVCATRKS
jgi:hypothetical protein